MTVSAEGMLRLNPRRRKPDCRLKVERLHEARIGAEMTFRPDGAAEHARAGTNAGVAFDDDGAAPHLVAGPRADVAADDNRAARHAKAIARDDAAEIIAGVAGDVDHTAGCAGGQIVSGVAANFVMLGYSRGDENDADKRAVRYMMKAGYDPNGLARFFELLQAKGDKGGGGVASYFRTHPPTADRIKRVREEIAKNGGSSGSYANRSFPADDQYVEPNSRSRLDLRNDGAYRRRRDNQYRDPYTLDPYR